MGMDTVEADQLPGRHSLPAQEEGWTLSYRADAPAQARRLTKETLQRWKVPAATTDEALLVVSELVTNAVEYARPPIVLRLDHGRGNGQVRVEVSDGGPAASIGEWAASCSDSEHGRGLTIVDQVAAAHGDRCECATGRATHWAELAPAA
ncbi:ATP-binding protein [Streptomyces sp. NPDC008238]